MTTAIYTVDGMTCGYCMAKVHQKVRSLSGVTNVAMDLGASGQSPLLVMSGTKLVWEAVRGAVESAGFGLLPPRGRDADLRGKGPSILDGDIPPDGQPWRTSIGGVRS
jgi:copper chaperone CopZ